MANHETSCVIANLLRNLNQPLLGIAVSSAAPGEAQSISQNAFEANMGDFDSNDCSANPTGTKARDSVLLNCGFDISSVTDMSMVNVLSALAMRATAKPDSADVIFPLSPPSIPPPAPILEITSLSSTSSSLAVTHFLSVSSSHVDLASKGIASSIVTPPSLSFFTPSLSTLSSLPAQQGISSSADPSQPHILVYYNNDMSEVDLAASALLGNDLACPVNHSLSDNSLPVAEYCPGSPGTAPCILHLSVPGVCPEISTPANPTTDTYAIKEPDSVMEGLDVRQSSGLPPLNSVCPVCGDRLSGM